MTNQGIKQQKRHIHISSKHKWFDLKLKEVWRYRDLIWLFTKRSFTVTYKQTVLGPAWLFLNPIITSLIYAFVFGGIAGIGTDGVPQILFYLSGTAIWSFFSTCLTKNATTFTSNAGVFGKVYFPRLTTPISNVLSSVIQFGIQFLMVLAFLLFFVITGEVSPNWWAFSLIPLVLLHLGMMGMGFGIIISSMTTKYRDLAVLVSFGMSLWMFATPVIYPYSQIPEGWIRTASMLNPVTPILTAFRYALFGAGFFSLRYYAISLIVTGVVFLAGLILFSRIERTFMDTI